MYAIGDTGPLISAFQSDSFTLLGRIFSEVHVPPACVLELTRHGWSAEVAAAAPTLVIVQLTDEELLLTQEIARAVAIQSGSSADELNEHAGEAQVIALGLRAEYQHDILLLDEQAARIVAQEAGLPITGFPGVLLLAAGQGLITPTDVRERLEQCRRQGTYYSSSFIQQVYELALKERSDQ